MSNDDLTASGPEPDPEDIDPMRSLNKPTAQPRIDPMRSLDDPTAQPGSAEPEGHD